MILHDLISYDMLRLIWWALLGIILIGFAITGGFDLGVGTLLPFVARDDTERRIVINSVGATWEGNQVWLVLAGGALFAAWPPLYAVSFSGFYLAIFAALFALILRPVGFKYRSKRESPRWRSAWDWALFIGGFVPALIFGVAIGNVLQGAPFRFDNDLRIFYEGSFFGLLNPYALLCGLVSVTMLITHGAAWLAVKTDGVVAGRSRNYGAICAWLTILLFALGGWFLTPYGYRITSPILDAGPSNPLIKTAIAEQGAWFLNFAAHPWMWVAPAFGFIGALGAALLLKTRSEIGAFLMSSLSIFGIISTVGLAMFPFILPSSIDPASGLTVWDSSSSHITLFIMLVTTVIFVPIIVLYTTWVYHVLWGKVNQRTITHGDHSY